MAFIQHCISKTIPDIIDCNLKNDYHISIIFGTNIPDTTDYQTSSHLTQHLFLHY